MPGVGSGPVNKTCTPAEVKPACKAASNIYPEIRVSLPKMMVMCVRNSLYLVNTLPAALPNFKTKSGVITELPTFPLIPSVPKYFFNITCIDHLITFVSCDLMVPYCYEAELQLKKDHRLINLSLK